jgi:hypothetical protein
MMPAMMMITGKCSCGGVCTTVLAVMRAFPLVKSSGEAIHSSPRLPPAPPRLTSAELGTRQQSARRMRKGGVIWGRAMPDISDLELQKGAYLTAFLQFPPLLHTFLQHATPYLHGCRQQTPHVHVPASPRPNDEAIASQFSSAHVTAHPRSRKLLSIVPLLMPS